MPSLTLPYVMVILSLAWTVSYAYPGGGATEDPISSICPIINKYLHSAYGCRPEDFRRHVACDDNRIDIRCPRSKQIAVHSASYGWSDRLTTDCPAARTYDTGCPRVCALRYVTEQCQSKRRCVFDASEVGGGLVSEPNRCRVPGTIKYFGIIYTCVKKSTMRHIESSDDGFVNPCDEDHLDEVELGQAVTPAAAKTLDHFGQPQSATYHWNADAPRSVIEAEQLVKALGPRGEAPEELRHTTLDWFLRPPSTQRRELRAGLVPSSSGGGNSVRVQTAPPGAQRGQMLPGDRSPPPRPPSLPILVYSLMDWLWTWKYVNENTEKFVLYMLLGLSLGTIAILVAILFHLVLCPRHRLSKDIQSSAIVQQGITATCSSPTWRMPESESSTGDDRTLHDDDVELTSFNHIDSLQRHATYHPHQATAPYRPPSVIGVPQSPTVPTTTTTATINRSYSQANPVVTRCYTPSPPVMTLPPVSCAPNGGFATTQQTMGNGRVEVISLPQGHCVGSLGRTYSNHYRRDSYQLDPAPGCRTLQPMQHYYG